MTKTKSVRSVTTIPLPRPPDGRLLHPKNQLIALAQILATRPAALVTAPREFVWLHTKQVIQFPTLLEIFRQLSTSVRSHGIT